MSDGLTLDPQNANLGTSRGRALLKESIETCGAARSILVDKHNVVIAGNKTLEEARALGLPIEVVEADGQDLVVVQRTDLDLLEDVKARQLTYYDNRVGEIDLSWSGEQIHRDLSAGVNLSAGFFPEEIDRLTGPMNLPPAVDLSSPLEPPQTQAEPAEETAQASTAPPAPRAPSGRSTYFIIFDTAEQHLTWSAFVRRLRERYPDLPTPGAKLEAYLTSIGVPSHV